MKKINKILCALISVLFSVLVFSTVGFAEEASTNHYDIIGGYVFYPDKYVESPDGIIKERLPWVMNQSADDEEIDFYVSVNYNISKDEFTGNIKLAKEFFTEKNNEFVKTLPENVKVTFIDSYSPVIGMTGTKAVIYEIAKMDNVVSMWEGEKYWSIDPLTQGTNTDAPSTVPEPTKNSDIIGDYVFYQDKYVESPDGIIEGKLPWVMNQSADDEEIDFYVWANYDINKDNIRGNKELAKAFFTGKNEEFVKTLPENVKVTFIDSYSPVIGMTGTKAAIYEIAKMDTVASMWEGFKYLSIDPLTQGPNANYYSGTLKVDGKDTSFIENEYYRAYADVFGKHFCDKFDSEKPEKKIADELAAVIKESAEPTYVTVIFAEIPSDTAAAAEALKIKESDIVALCKTYPAAMIKISADNSDILIENENVKAIYSAFPTAIQREYVNHLILEEKYKPTSADARKILRYTARLDSAPKDMAEGKKFFFMSDADLDGKLTSSDARTALRIAAKLEEGKVYWKESQGAGAFWQDAYYIK